MGDSSINEFKQFIIQQLREDNGIATEVNDANQKSNLDRDRDDADPNAQGELILSGEVDQTNVKDTS